MPPSEEGSARSLGASCRVVRAALGDATDLLEQPCSCVATFGVESSALMAGAASALVKFLRRERRCWELGDVEVREFPCPGGRAS